MHLTCALSRGPLTVQDSMRVTRLKAELKKLGLSTAGNKTDLEDRMSQIEANYKRKEGSLRNSTSTHEKSGKRRKIQAILKDDEYASFLIRVLHQIKPELNILNLAMVAINECIAHSLDQLSQELEHFEMVNVEVVADCIERLLPGDLGHAAINAGEEAIKKFARNYVNASDHGRPRLH